MPEENPEFLDPFDDCPWLPARDLFARLGFVPEPPAAINDTDLPGRLWEFIYALAGRRFYLHDTDHLSDRELYVWLYDEWLPEETADVPPEAEFNCHVDASEYGTGSESGTNIWLRYYASPRDREEWLMGAEGEPLPPHEDLPFDRDRWLPEAPVPLTPDTDGEEDDGEPDPLGLAAVDREIRREHAFAEPDALETELAATEPDTWERPYDQLNRAQVVLPPPAELTDESVPAKLWELLHELACRGFHVLHSDHLDDRELYTTLWREGLREPAMLPGKSRTGAWFHDCLGSWDEDDTLLWLRYYASDEERANHVRDDPGFPLPPKEKPPFNRDWRLPKGPF